MFNPNDYPLCSDIKNKFSFAIEVLPFPDSKDFRLSLSENEIDKIKSNLENKIKQTQEKTTKELFNRLYTNVKHMSEKLQDDKSVFRDSLISNLQSLVKILPDLNINDDSTLEAMGKEVESTLCNYKAQGLRDDTTYRKQGYDESNKILEKLEGYIGK
jgi:ribosomal protein L16 Arg81 hydroxylase